MSEIFMQAPQRGRKGFIEGGRMKSESGKRYGVANPHFRHAVSLPSHIVYYPLSIAHSTPKPETLYPMP